MNSIFKSVAKLSRCLFVLLPLAGCANIYHTVRPENLSPSSSKYTFEWPIKDAGTNETIDHAWVHITLRIHTINFIHPDSKRVYSDFVEVHNGVLAFEPRYRGIRIDKNSCGAMIYKHGYHTKAVNVARLKKRSGKYTYNEHPRRPDLQQSSYTPDSVPVRDRRPVYLSKIHDDEYEWYNKIHNAVYYIEDAHRTGIYSTKNIYGFSEYIQHEIKQFEEKYSSGKYLERVQQEKEKLSALKSKI